MLGRRASADTIAGLVNTSRHGACTGCGRRARGWRCARSLGQKKACAMLAPRCRGTTHPLRPAAHLRQRAEREEGLPRDGNRRAACEQAVEAAVLDEIRDSDEQMVFYDVGVDGVASI